MILFSTKRTAHAASSRRAVLRGLAMTASAVLISGVALMAGASVATAETAESQHEGSFPINFENKTHGKFSDDQIHILIMGMGSDDKWSYAKPDGTLVHLNYKDKDAPGHLTKDGRNYAKMSFTLSEVDQVWSPLDIHGGRIYISLGSPMHIAIAPDSQGWTVPDPNTDSDPNRDIDFDWYEYTYQHGKVPFGGNTTQVDMFGFPITSRVVQKASDHDSTRGITLTRDEVRQRYREKTGSTPFGELMDDRRIVAPRSASTFRPGGDGEHYMREYIDQAWEQYATKGLKLNRLNEIFTSVRVDGDRLEFIKNGDKSKVFSVNKPSTRDVLQCSGSLAKAGMSPEEGVMGAELCAAFNRGVALDPGTWYSPSSYYRGSVANDYAGFFHSIGVDAYAYGFAYDDVNSQSSVQILPNSEPPTSLTLGIGW